MLDKHSVTDLHPQALIFFLIFETGLITLLRLKFKVQAVPTKDKEEGRARRKK